jgi:hypothetical protein
VDNELDPIGGGLPPWEIFRLKGVQGAASSALAPSAGPHPLQAHVDRILGAGRPESAYGPTAAYRPPKRASSGAEAIKAGARQYIEESADAMKSGSRQAVEEGKEFFTDFGKRMAAAQPPAALEAGALGQVITGPAYRAGAAALGSEAVEDLAAAGMGLPGQIVPRVPRAAAGREAGAAAEKISQMEGKLSDIRKETEAKKQEVRRRGAEAQQALETGGLEGLRNVASKYRQERSGSRNVASEKGFGEPARPDAGGMAATDVPVPKERSPAAPGPVRPEQGEEAPKTIYSLTPEQQAHKERYRGGRNFEAGALADNAAKMVRQEFKNAGITDLDDSTVARAARVLTEGRASDPWDAYEIADSELARQDEHLKSIGVTGETPFGVGAAAAPTRPPPLLATPESGAQALIRQQHGLAAQDTARAHEAIEKTPLPGHNISMAQAETRASQDEKRLFRQYIETRTKNPDLRHQLSPALQEAADLEQSMMRDYRYAIEDLDPEEKQRFLQDYLPHMWERNDALAKFISGGGSSHLKQRTLPTYEEGIELGFVPKHALVTDMLREYVRIMDRFNAARRVEGALKDQGHIMAAEEGRVPAGWERIESGRLGYGHRAVYAPKAIARDYNKFYAEGIAAPWMKALTTIANDSKKLAFAGSVGQFHGVNELIEGLGMTLARFADNIRVGQFGRAAGALATPAVAMLKGHKGFKIYAGKFDRGAYARDVDTFKYMNPDDAEAIGILAQVHGIPSQREFLDIDLSDHAIAQQMRRNGWTFANLGVPFKPLTRYPSTGKAWKQGGAARAKVLYMAPAELLHGILGVSSEMAHPLFNWAIPRLKLGTNILRWQDWKRANPFAPKSEMLSAARKIADASDNLFGEMNRDNLVFRRYINKSLLQALDVTMLAPGWNIGSGELFARGITGVPRALAGPATRRLGIDPNAPSLAMSSKHWDPNISSAYGTVVSGLILGGLATWAMTGRPPKDSLDFVAARTGAKRHGGKRAGQDIRLAPQGNLAFGLSMMRSAGLPSAGMEGFVPGASPLSWAREKLNPAASILADLIARSDWKGDPNTPSSLAEHLRPFALQAESGYSNKNLPAIVRLLSLREGGMQWEDPKGFARKMREKYGR